MYSKFRRVFLFLVFFKSHYIIDTKLKRFDILGIMSTKQLIISLLILSMIAFILELIYQAFRRAKQKHFSWDRYLIFASFPLAMSALMMYGLGASYIIIFAVSAIIGTFCEWLFGHYYFRIVGEKLWKYKRLNITEYVSLLTLPVWGFAGILFALLGQIIIRK